MTNDKWLQAEEIAERLQVHIETVRRWLRSGELRGILLGGRSGYRVSESDLEEFLQEKYNRPRSI